MEMEMTKGMTRRMHDGAAASAKLTWERVVDVGASSSSIPGNGARKMS
jgi:hypothetical protein